jgi:hypothetical protein
MPESLSTSNDLLARAREDQARAERDRALQPASYTLAALCESCGLDHHILALEGNLTLADLQSRLLANRPLLLEHLRGLGMEKLAERQRLANAVGKAEKAGQLPPPEPKYPHLVPSIYEQDKETMTVRLKVASGTSSNQLKVRIDFHQLSVQYCTGPTAVNGKLHGAVKPSECTWQIEREPPPEYDPLVSASEQPVMPDDTLVITLQKDIPEPWSCLFVDAVAKKCARLPSPS